LEEKPKDQLLDRIARDLCLVTRCSEAIAVAHMKSNVTEISYRLGEICYALAKLELFDEAIVLYGTIIDKVWSEGAYGSISYCAEKITDPEKRRVVLQTLSQARAKTPQ
jgi:phosphatidylinositol kinase/protein kinase (PI-3  family)